MAYRLAETAWAKQYKEEAQVRAQRQADMLRKMHEAPVQDPAVGDSDVDLIHVALVAICEAMCGSCELSVCVRTGR